MQHESTLGPTSEWGIKKISRVQKAPLWWKVRNLRNYLPGLFGVWLAWMTHWITGLPVIYGTLRLKVKHANGTWTDYGVVSHRLVTTAGVNYIVTCFTNSTEAENMKFHGYGVGVTAAAIGDTALGTEETTQYNPDSTRPTGSNIVGTSSNIYRSVATYSPDSGTNPRPITEVGIFSQAATGGGTLLDRFVFSVVNLVPSSDSLQTTFDLTFTAGS